MADEFRHHLELRTGAWLRRGLSPLEARRRARIEFGNVEVIREEARVSRGLRVLDALGVSWLDLRLGARMLVKYPGLSLVSVMGMSIGIAIGAGGFGFIHAVVDAPLPLAEGERVVSLQNSMVPEARQSGPGEPCTIFWSGATSSRRCATCRPSARRSVRSRFPVVRPRVCGWRE